MVAADVITLARQLLDDPNSTGRWSDTALLLFLNEAQQDVIRDVQFPQTRLVSMTQPNLQEYTLPEIITIYTVYLAGQLIVPTNLKSIEGHQTQDYDQGLNSGIYSPSPQIPGSGGPPGTGGQVGFAYNNSSLSTPHVTTESGSILETESGSELTTEGAGLGPTVALIPGTTSSTGTAAAGGTGGYTPAWNVQTPGVYPFANSWGEPAPDAQMWTVGQRPRWYMRSGNIGFIPAPANTVTLVIDGLVVPQDVTVLQGAMIFPQNFRRLLAWKVCELAKFSDDSDRAAEARTFAGKMYEQTKRKILADMKLADGDQPRMPKLRTYRRSYQIGNNRQGQGFTEYP